MTQIKKITDKQGNDIYLRTHTKAVVDDNGYTAESRLQAMQDEINQKQLELGAIPSDLTPTEGSSNWVTSGGLYNSIYPIDEDLYGKRIYNNFESEKYIDQGTNNIKSNSNWALTEYIPVTPYDTVRVVFQTTGSTGISCATFFDATKQAINSWTTNNYTNERTIPAEVSEGETGSRAYVRCGLYLSNIETCEVYVNSELVWNYTGRIDDGWKYSDVKRRVEEVDINNHTLYENIIHGKIIDARVDSETFGQEIQATNNDWACTPYIDISKANGGIKYVWQSGSPSANYYGKAGVVFYDTDYQPLIEGVRVIKQTSTGTATVETDTVPRGAMYMRATVWAGTGKVELFYSLYKLVPDNIFGLEKVMEDIDTTLDNTVYAEELSILRNARTTADTGVMTGSVGLLHFSDIHGDEGAAKAIKAYYDKYSSYINNMLSTGDVVYYYAADGIDFYTQNGLTDALMALGNHDGASQTGSNVQGSADWDAMGAQWDYETYYAPYISGWGVTQPTDAAANYLMYYYKDYTTPKVRLIVLDVMHQTAEQLQWFTDTLADAVTNDYTAVVASHYIPNTFVETNVVKKSDGDKTSFHWLGSNAVTSIDNRFKLATTYADAVETFIANGGKFAVWLCGHYHLDFFTYSNTHPNILFCAINQAGYRRGGGQGYRVIGDHCANMVTIHPALGVIKIHRIGLTTDKYLRPINVLVYDYVNKKVISNY